ncbi:uncharacterized protein LOC131044117 isoform X2 [Cryptomeria japonica]|uniref:uncharacterized protein LOC131044117 isoform X2 n=1 Tax=Cryptomeria japonica TaxID=3369 RepID=UPI0027DA3CEE|nr:uncharacterized protein LOC131044117 isoform X2 [Cryptomeria japonica]
MDSFVVRLEKNKSTKRRIWERDIWEIEGKFSSTYRHRIVRRLLKSYSELNLSHKFVSEGSILSDRGSLRGREWISSLEFDSKGIYLASVTSTGCLKVHDYESLCCKCASAQMKDGRKKNDFRDEAKPIVEISTREKLDAVRWNPTNQDEIGCVSERNGKVLLFDIGYESSKPSQVLERKLNPSEQEDMEHFGLSDLAFSSGDKFRLLACGLDGNVHMWDRRTGKFSCSVTSDLFDSRPLSCLQWTYDEQIVYAGCKTGNVYAWDLREGRTSTAFLSHNEVYRPPLETITIASLLEDISSLKAQTEIISSGVQSVNLNPSCWYQLAFHLNNGWSGVLNLNSKKVTHIHCPPPPWMTRDSPTASFYHRKPAWLPSVSQALPWIMESIY